MKKLFDLPYLLIIFATLLWAGNFTIGKVIVTSVPPVTIALIRWSLSCIVFSPFAIKEVMTHRRELLSRWKVVLGFTLTGIVIFNTLVYISVQYTSSVNVSLIDALSPSLILLLAFYWLKEPLRGIQIFGMLVSFIGVVWMIINGSIHQLLSLSFNRGDLLMLAAVLSWGIYSVMMKRYGPTLPVNSTFFLTMLIGVIILIPLSVPEWSTFSFHGFGTLKYIQLLYLGTLPSVVAFVFWNRAVLLIGPTKAGIYLNLIAVFAAIISSLFLHVPLSFAQVSGGLLVFLGVFITTRLKTWPWAKKKDKTPQAGL